MMLAIVMTVLSALTLGSTDVTGKWEGQLTATRRDGSTHHDTVLFVLAQKDGAITGTIVGGETDQHPIISGTTDGATVAIGARQTGGEREFRPDLRLQNEELSGTMTAGERRAEVRTKRRKE